ncbi:MAG TPA: glycine cleavage system protein GcvH [Acidimicrobiaceae bacterium]|nr:glycine cleavage system protein H [Acidimicrobiaceae bacterium]HAQ23257.1 glycine cleavage system protein GcvH [Acidimicrobiaceae bacterium]HCV33906.1 glycine cleavage system protein GcvH [Acidimicrobiaceae bacterium]
MVNIPDDLKYSFDHEWVRDVGGGVVQVGITDYAQDALGDVVFVELPTVGTSVEARMVFGEVESTKSVSELFAPVTGEVVAANEDLETGPGRINEDPYGEGWICEVRVIAEGDLMDADAYRLLIEG